MAGCQRFDFAANRKQFGEHKVVTTDIPARFQTYLVVHQADRSDALNIGLVETTREQSSPMRTLGVFQSRNVVSEQPRKMTLLRDMPIKIVQEIRERRLDLTSRIRAAVHQFHD